MGFITDVLQPKNLFGDMNLSNPIKKSWFGDIAFDLRLGANTWGLKLKLTLIFLAFALGGGVLVAVLGPIGGAVVVGLLIAVSLFLAGSYHPFWISILVLLTGYQFMGKGFAYFGVYPAYVSELGMMLGMYTLMLSIFSKKIRINTNFPKGILALMCLLLVWSFARSIPYFAEHNFDAVRDVMLIGYAFYALIIGLIIPPNAIEKFFAWYKKVIPFFLLCVPAIILLTFAFELPIRFPGSPVGLIHNKAGDVGVHMAGAITFAILRLDKFQGKSWSNAFVWILWMMWGAGLGLAGAISRGGMVSNAMALMIVFSFRPKSKIHQPIVIGIVALWVLLLTGAYSDLKVSGLSDHHREISAEQVVNNIISVVSDGGDESKGGVEGTEEWRISWWTDIIGYTFNGEHFWLGRGYGPNLADLDGYQVPEGDLRSPHNAHMTILARSGVPGFVLWLSLLGSFALWMIYHVVSNWRSNPWKSKIALWLLAYTAAVTTNASFDVFLEGPMGGVWFWCLIGISIAYFSGTRDDKVDPSKELPKTLPV